MERIKQKAIIVGILIIIAYSMLLSTIVPPIIGLFTETVSGAAVIGIAILMYPLFKPYKLNFFYLSLKSIEGMLMFAAGIFVLLENFKFYDKIYAIHVYPFAIGAFIFYILLYKTRLIPRFISIWGLIAAVFVLVANIYTQLGFELPMIVAVLGYAPIILNEVFLAIFLIIKGFDKRVLT